MLHKLTSSILLECCVLAVVVAMAGHSRAEQEPESYKYYYLEAKVVSLGANQSLSSYRRYGGGSGTPGTNLGYCTPGTTVSIDLTVESDRFYADVTIRDRRQPIEGDAKKQRIDLTNLRPTFLDLGVDKDGRTYQLNLTPSVVSKRLKAYSFREAADDLYRLQFHSSRIMLNDTRDIGRMLASDAEVFSIDVCGVASLEFSLLHLKDAEPWGQLQNGQITLKHPDGTVIEIGNVTNGTHKRLIDGGPYTVWVRWGKPQQTVEEYRKSLSALRDRIASGETKAMAWTLAALEKELAREPGAWVTGCGARGPQKDDIVHDD